jgi:hypothetical protein
MSEKDSKNEILNALEKLDKDSAQIEQSQKISKAHRKVSPKEPQVSIDEKIDSQVKKQNEEYFDNLKQKAIQGGILFILTFIVVNALTRDQRTTLIENIIIVILCLGLVASKKV